MCGDIGEDLRHDGELVQANIEELIKAVIDATNATSIDDLDMKEVYSKMNALNWFASERVQNASVKYIMTLKKYSHDQREIVNSVIKAFKNSDWDFEEINNEIIKSHKIYNQNIREIVNGEIAELENDKNKNTHRAD